MTQTPPDQPARHANGRFGPGNPGRRAGSRNRASHEMIMSIFKDFESNKNQILERLRNSYSPQYFNTLARLAPQMLDDGAPVTDGYSDAEVAVIVSRARQALAVTPDPRGALAELEALMSHLASGT